MFTFAMALLIVYLVLAAQFESFIHPLVIMLTVPLAVLGALLGLWVSGGDAEPLQPDRHRDAGRPRGEERHPDRRLRQPAARRRAAASREAIVEAAAVRLRPILMTSIATIAGAVPLVAAGGPGSASRSAIGVVVIFGVAFSTLLSLFVVPSFYALLAPHTDSPEALSKEIERLEVETPQAAEGT